MEIKNIEKLHWPYNVPKLNIVQEKINRKMK